MKRYLSAVGALALIFGSMVAAHAQFSDDFSATQPSSTNTGLGFDTGSTLLTSYGSRLLQTDIISNSAPGDARGRTAISTNGTPPNGALTYSSEDEVTGYGYATYSFTTPISLTLTPDFQFTFLNNDALGTFSIGVFDGTGHSATVSYVLPVMPTAAASLVLTVPANLTGVTGTNITKLVFSFGGAKSEDLSVDGIVAVTAPAVPEPRSLGMIVLLGGLAAAGKWVRRRRA